MYDTIDINLKKEMVPGTNFIETVPQHLTKVTSEGNTNFGYYINGYLENLKVKITENRVIIFESSICKYYLGDNFQTLSKGLSKRAIEKISDTIHLPFNIADVTRIDVAHNLIMQHETDLYCTCLGEAKHYKRLPQDNGLYYSNRLRQLAFYGKVKEQREKRQPIPLIYQNRNVLRIELRLKHRLRQQFNRPEIKAWLLYDERFYRELLKRWKNEYLSIQKINSKIFRMKPTGSTKELIENLALYSIIEAGQPQILNLIKQWQETGEIDKHQAKRHRAFIKKLASKNIDGNSNELIEELNQKIKQAARNY